VTQRRQDRLAALQLHFEGGGVRHFLIMTRPMHKNHLRARPAQWWAQSLSRVVGEHDLDLRRPEHALRLEKALLALDLSRITG